MKILIDTNVIIDILQKREPFFGESYHALRKAIENDVECMISASAVTDIFYMLRKSLGSNHQAKEQIQHLHSLWILPMYRGWTYMLPLCAPCRILRMLW